MGGPGPILDLHLIIWTVMDSSRQLGLDGQTLGCLVGMKLRHLWFDRVWVMRLARSPEEVEAG